MKRTDLVRLLESKGCTLFRHGGRHDVFVNPATGKRAPVPRHREIPPTLVKMIMRQLGVEAD